MIKLLLWNEIMLIVMRLAKHSNTSLMLYVCIFLSKTQFIVVTIVQHIYCFGELIKK